MRGKDGVRGKDHRKDASPFSEVQKWTVLSKKWTFVPLGLSFCIENEENWVYTIGMHLLNSLT